MNERWTLGRRITTFAGVVARTIAGGGALAREETIAQRSAICQQCSYVSEDGKRCIVCTCNVETPSRRWLGNLMRKIAHPSSICPMYFWGEEGKPMAKTIEGMSDIERADLEAHALQRAQNIAQRERQLKEIPRQIAQLQERLEALPAEIEQLKQEADNLPFTVTVSPRN